MLAERYPVGGYLASLYSSHTALPMCWERLPDHVFKPPLVLLLGKASEPLGGKTLGERVGHWGWV